MDIEREREDRFRFLRSLWEGSEGSEFFRIGMWELGEELGLDRPTVDRIFRFLSGEGLLKGVDIGGGISITHRGIVEVERALSKPDEPTQYFPPVNVIAIGTMSNSVIQQASPNATQNVSIDATEVEGLRSLLADVESRLDALALDMNERQQVEADIATIKAQLSAPSPRRSIVTESLLSLRTILEQVAAAAIAAPLIAKIATILVGV
ncbi:MAG: hypothetical protein Q8K99_10895 [Actinomycetota bacterium]|nr:hypothetical protein [Actinomycetota bacterium]